MRRVDLALLIGISLALGVTSLFRDVDWFLWAGVLVWAIGWEITKLRLRRNARAFAEGSR